jgi:WD40 repeat protein
MKRVVIVAVVAACGAPSTSKPTAGSAGVAAPESVVAPVATPVPLPTDRLFHHRPLLVGLTNVEEIDLSADGGRIAAVGDEGGVVVERASGKVLRKIAGEADDGVALAADGARVVVIRDVDVEMYDVASGKRIAKRAGTIDARPSDVVRCGDGYLLTIHGQAGRLLDADLRERGTLEVAAKDETRRATACHGDRAVVVSTHEIFVYSVATRKLVSRAEVAHQDPNGLVDVVAGERYVAAMTNTGSLWVFDAGGKLVGERLQLAGQAQEMALSPDESVLAAGGVLLSLPDLTVRTRIPDGSARRFTPDGAWLINARTYDLDLLDVAALARTVDGHVDRAMSMSLSPDGNLLATGGSGRVYLWKLGGDRPSGAGMGPLVAVLDAHGGGVFGAVSVAFHPDGTRLFSAGNGVIRVWDVATRAPLAGWMVGDERESEVSLHVDKHHLVATGSDHVYVYTLDGAPVATLGSFQHDTWNGSVKSVALFPDGKHLAVSSADGKVAVFERTGKRVAERPPVGDARESFLTMSPDGKRLLDVGWNRNVALGWPGLDEKATFDIPRIGAAAWSADGSSVAWASWENGVGVLQLGSGGVRERWKSRTPWHAYAIAWDHARGLLYSTGADDGILIWDAHTGKQLATWAGARGERIETAVFSADRSLLVTHQPEIGSLRVWDLATFTQVLHAPEIYVAEETQPRLVGDRLVALGVQGQVHRWQREAGTWRALPDWKPPDTCCWRGMGISADGATAYIATAEETRREWLTIDTATAKVTSRTKPATKLYDFDIEASDPAGRYVVLVGERDFTLELWDLASGKRARTLETGDDYRDAVFAGDDVLLDTETPLWSTATGKTRAGCSAERGLLGIAADGRRTIHIRGAIHIALVGVCTDEHVLYATGDEDTAALAGDTLVVTDDGELTIWDLARKEPVAVLRGLRDGLWSSRIVGKSIAPGRVTLPAR